MNHNATALDNLALWQDSLLSLQELCQLQCLQMGREAGEQWRRRELSQPFELRLPAPDSTEAQHPIPIGVLLRVIGVQQQLAFCRGFLESCPDYLSETDQLPLGAPPPASPRVVFWDNYFGREALRRFKAVLPLPRPVTAPSFTAVCEELAGGRADFALLPLGDSREGKMLHLYEEIDRFELHITHTCDIPYPDEGRSISVALLSRLYAPTARANSELLIACRVPGEEHALSEILSAASSAGLSLTQIDSLPDPYDANGVTYHPILRADRDPALFEAYLSICHPRARIVSKYFHLITKEN